MKSGLFITALFLSAALSYAQDTKISTVDLATPPAAENKNAPEITFTEDAYDFGTIKQGDSIVHKFTFTNTGKEPLIITDAKTVCGCTVPEWPKEPIKKGAKSSITVVFRSGGKVGVQDRTVTITSNAKTNPKVIHLKGIVEVPKQAGEQTAPAIQENQTAPLEIKSK